MAGVEGGVWQLEKQPHSTTAVVCNTSQIMFEAHGSLYGNGACVPARARWYVLCVVCSFERCVCEPHTHTHGNT